MRKAIFLLLLCTGLALDPTYAAIIDPHSHLPIEEYTRTARPDSVRSIQEHFPELYHWLLNIIKGMEAEINRTRPEKTPQRKLKEFHLYHSSLSRGAPAVLFKEPDEEKKELELPYTVILGSDDLRDIFSALYDPHLDSAKRTETFKKGLEVLEGVIAHEMGRLAHSSQHLLNEGLQLSSDEEDTLANQNHELAADQEGLRLTRKLGLSGKAIVAMLEHYAPKHRTVKNGQHDSTLPSLRGENWEYRNSAARMATLIDTFRTGSSQELPRQNEAALLQEILKLPINDGPPSTLELALDRFAKIATKLPEIQKELLEKLKPFPNNMREDYDKYVEYQEYLKTVPIEHLSGYCKLYELQNQMDWVVLRLSEQEKIGLSEPLKARFLSLAEKYFHSPDLIHINAVRVDLLNKVIHTRCQSSRMQVKVPDHELSQAIESSPLLQGDAYLKIALPTIPDNPSKTFEEAANWEQLRPDVRSQLEILWTTQRYIPTRRFSDYWIKHFFPVSLNAVRRDPLILATPRFAKAQVSLGEERGQVTDWEYTMIQAAAAIVRQGKLDWINGEFIGGIGFNRYEYEFLMDVIGFSNLEIGKDPWNKLNEQDRNSIRTFARYLWAHRGELGLYEFHWPNIWKILELDPEKAKEELNSAVTRHLNESKTLFRISGIDPRPENKNPPDAWAKPEVVDAYNKNATRFRTETPDPMDSPVGLFRDLMPRTVSQWLSHAVFGEWDSAGLKPKDFASFIDKKLQDPKFRYYERHSRFLEGELSPAHGYPYPGFQETLNTVAPWDAILDGIDHHAKYDTATKKALLQSLLDSVSDRFRRERAPFSQDLGHALELFEKYGLFATPEKMFEWVSQFGGFRWQYFSHDSKEICFHQTGFLSFIDPFLNRTLKQQSPAQRMRQAHFYLDPFLPGGGRAAFKAEEKWRISDGFEQPACILSEYNLRETKKTWVNDFLTQNDEADQIIKNFKLLTLTGSTYDTDRYLKEKLQVLQQSEKYPEWRKEWLTFKKWDKTSIHGKRFLAKLASEEIDYRTQNGESFADLKEFVVDLYNNKSRDRDQLLEQIVWKFPELKSAEIKEVIDPLKTRFLDGSDYPYLTNLISTVGSYLEGENPKQKSDWIRYLLDPNPQNKSLIIGRISEWASRDAGFLKEQKQEAWMETFHQEILNASPDERTPLLEYFLGAVSQQTGIPLYQVPEFPELMKEWTGSEPKSKKWRMMKAYLNSCQPFERPAILAYYLAHQNESEDNGVRALFEVFSTVGIKTGQLASILGTFSDDTIRANLSTLKDSATPLDKGQVLTILERALDKERFEKEIKGVHRILGSASIKMVVDVELNDGAAGNANTHLAGMIRRPYAKPLIQEHLNRTKRFMEELKKDPELAQEVGDIEPLRKIIEEELKEEVDFELEAKKTRRAGEIYDTISKPKSVTVRGQEWTIEVPQMSKQFPQVYQVPKADYPENKDDPAPTVMFNELADGVPLSKVKDPKAKTQAGEVIANELVQQLFAKGFMNADPHRGNFLINEKEHKIYFIDFGQAETFSQVPKSTSFFSQTEIEIFSHFLAALHQQILPNTILYATQFCQPEVDSATQTRIRKRLQALKAKKRLEMTDVINAFNSSGATFSKQFFGILKGLAVLEREKFIPQGDFQSLVAGEVKAVIQANWTWRDKAEYTVNTATGLVKQAGQDLIYGISSQLEKLNKEPIPPQPECK